MDQAVSQLLSRHEDALRHYGELLASYKGRIRLTGPADPEILWKEHILDCLASVPLLPPEGKIIDVGSGGGLPGLVWALCRPDLEVILLDSVRKKCGALAALAADLGLANVAIAWSRVEDYARANREVFDLAGCRALASAGILVEYLSPLVKTGGTILAFKGPSWHDEAAPLEGKWARLRLSAPRLIPYEREEKKLFFVLWTKTAPCPADFPRKAGTAEKLFWWR